jgi:hypothetical protein
MEDEIEVLSGDLLVRREVAVFIALTANRPEAQLWHRCSRRRQRPGAAGAAALAADGELVKIVAPRLEPADLDMHGVTELGMRRCRAFLYHLPQAFVRGYGPVDLHGLPRHAAAASERARRNLRPDHEAVRRRITGSDAEREGRGSEDRAAPDADPKEITRRRMQGGGTQPAQERAAVHGAEVSDIQASRESMAHGSTSLHRYRQHRYG